jgi:hypothetical protein
MMQREGCLRDASDCRISTTSTVKQPAIDWSPVFDGKGGMVNSDPNTFIVTYTCATCMTSWSTETTGGNAIHIAPRSTEGEQP